MIPSETLAAAARVEAHAVRRLMAGLVDHSAASGASESRPLEAAALPLRQPGKASNELQFLLHSSGEDDFPIRPAAPVDASGERHTSAMAGNDNLQASSSL